MMCRLNEKLNENKKVRFSKNSWTFEIYLSIQVCKKREIHAVRAKNADCTCTHSTKNKIQHEADRALWY